jgi:hypothetical protein
MYAKSGDRGAARRARSLTVLTALLGGLVFAACSSGSTSSTTTTTQTSTGSSAPSASGGSASALNTVENGITKSVGATFSATYLTAHSSTGQSQSVTFAQSPPKSAVITPSGSFYLNGSSVTECQGSGSSATCTSLPSNLTSSLTGLTNLFSPGILTNTLKGIQAEEAAHVGVIVSESSGTYGGQASTCVTVKGSSQPSAVTYCAANSSGILSYANTAGSTVTLTAFSTNPPASTFSPPAGATVQTIPGGG